VVFSFERMKYLGLGVVGFTSILSAKVSAQGACVNSPSNRQCSGDFDINTDYYSNTPDTGRTVEVKTSLIVLTAVLVDGG
jgi:hypothetical protein